MNLCEENFVVKGNKIGSYVAVVGPLDATS